VISNPNKTGFAKWPVPLSAIGIILVTAATFLHYSNAHSQAEPGGYLAFALGALAIGLLVTLGSYFSRPKSMRSSFAATLAGVFASIVFVLVFLAILVRNFGS
jgi:hypothetical protein